ncbi:hypothetical protein SBADM41S_06891 [Streptomyces badius]
MSQAAASSPWSMPRYVAPNRSTSRSGRGGGDVEVHRAVTVPRLGGGEREPAAVGTDGGPDKGEARVAALGAVDPVDADDHETAVVRETRLG